MVGGRLRVVGRMSRAGNVQSYQSSDGKTIREYRPPEEVFSADSLRSARGAPITDLHPVDMVTAESWRQLAVGHIGDDVARDKDDEHTRATLWVCDRKAIDSVLNGSRQELSAGYNCEIDPTPGTSPAGEEYDVIQRNIDWNHVALLPQGQARGGPTVRIVDGVAPRVARLDTAGNEVIPAGAPGGRPGDGAVISAPRSDAKEQTMSKRTVKIDGAEHTFDAETDALAVAVGRVEDRAKAAEQKATEEKARADRAEGERDAAKTSAAAEKARADKAVADLAAATDPAKLAETARVLADAIDGARLIAGADFAPTGTAAEIRRASTRKALDASDDEGSKALAADLEKKDAAGAATRSDDYVAAIFDSLVRTAKGKAGSPTVFDARTPAAPGKNTETADADPGACSIADVHRARAAGAKRS